MWYNADMDKHIKKHNGPGVMGRQTRPPMSEEQKIKMVELVNAGFSRKSIAEALNVPYQSVNRELRELGMSVGQGKAKQQIITPEALAQMKAVLSGPRNDLATVVKVPLPKAVTNDEEAENRSKLLGHEILRGAERLLTSINTMSDEALAAATLHHRATALGILVDKLKVINNQAQPMFGATAGNQTMNIINIIAAATPPRAKDAKPESRKSQETDEPAIVIQPNQLTAKEQLRKEELDEDTFDGF